MSKKDTYFAYAFLQFDGDLDLDSISESFDASKWKMIENSMGWRFNHPERYSRDEQWERLRQYGKIVAVEVTVLEEKKSFDTERSNGVE